MRIREKIIAKKNDVKGAAPITIAFFGDSVTQGCFELYKTGEKSFQTEFRVEDGFHTKFRQILQMLYPSVPINMIHAGISGDSAPGGLLRVERDVCAFKPDLTVMCFGLNDCCKGRSNLHAYEDAVRGIICKLKECGSEIIFLTPNLMADSVSDEITDAWTRSVCANMIRESDGALEDYVAAARQICSEEQVVVCDCFRYWKILKDNEVDTTRLLSNRINHPTEAMNWLFAMKLVETIFEAGE